MQAYISLSVVKLDLSHLKCDFSDRLYVFLFAPDDRFDFKG